METPRHPRRFRRRLLAVMVGVGLLPLLGWGVASHVLTGRVLALRVGHLDELLARAEERTNDPVAEEALRQDIAAARVNLAQAELARRTLARLLPRALLLALGGSAALLAAAALLVGRQLGRPVALLVDGMSRYANGDLAYRIEETGGAPDEMAFLVQQFNRMGDDLARQRARLEVTEALAAWQGVARGLAHELKNPLTAMRMALGRLTRSGEGIPAVEERTRRLEATGLLEREIDVLLRLAQSFSTFAKLPSPQKRRTELGPVLADVCALYGTQSPVPLDCHLPAELALEADPELLRRAFGNLVKNALEASSPGADPVTVTVDEERGMVRIEIADRGVGIGEIIEGARLSASLGTTKREGSGLGLPIAHKILHEHGGSLRLEPRDGGGTLAVILLPCRREVTA